jgi:hypothetical protein
VVERDLRVDAFVPRGGYVIETDEATADALWGGELDPWPLRPLAFAQTGAIAKVNTDAGKCRSRYITVIPGQEMTYAEKEREALAYLADPSPVPADYPMLLSEATATGVMLPELAAEVVQVAEDWRLIGSEIEGIRRGAIVAVQQATTTAEVDAVTWHFPSPPVSNA